MAEVKTPPIITYDEYGNEQFTFTEAHSIADVARWAKSEGWGAELVYILQEELNVG